ncbi:uncharacterized protein LOC112455867, partial [Temnothorax curvispinosus]|uniref:Uncharacterized protein LOC112455867 n=1 Tax=Temnothorax curvispinosus TaxID=300111 RepID=A0A6J1PXA3_9HYME
MHEEIQVQTTENNSILDLQLGFLTKRGIDRGRYNVQKVNEVAAVFSTTADGEIPETYVTIYNKCNKTLQQVSIMDPNVEPWIYPLYYPYGTQGWHGNLRRKDSNKRISRAAYVKYRIAIRDNFNIFVMGRRLFQQWLVDSYVKIEKDRINYCKQNQKQLRAETYQGLIDYLANVANNSDAHIGKMVILPSTFVGSPRNMLQHYQDAMAIVRKYGKPDIFITMTCNPNWREIRENLLPGQQPADRPDICARVFNIKKDYLIDVIVRQKFFGEVLAYVYVIEFQKRGLPHIHLLITLKRNCKIVNPETVDRFISAKIPDPNENESLHNVVMKHMIHGPCGDWCLINDKCSKHFPKPFRPETTMDEDGYPQYRRRNNGLLYERPGRAACLALGLIEDDEEWYRAMNEAKVWMMPRRLRNLFVRILIHCQPVYPKKLWDEFKKDMSEDYIRRFGLIMGIKKAYNYIDNLLQIEGSNITNFPEMEQETEEQVIIDNEEQIEEDTLIGIRQYEQLSVEQKQI